jgi:hypothetical protein
LKLSRDGWAGLAVLAASLFLFALTLGLKPSPLVPIGPGFYPRIVSREKEKANYAAVVLHFGVFALYVVALPWLGFRVATFTYVAIANALLDPPRSAKGWLRVGAIALVTAAAAYVVFEYYLSVLMPRGRWTGF